MATTQKNRNSAVRKLCGRLMQRMRKRRQERAHRQEISSDGAIESDGATEKEDPPGRRRRWW